MALPTYENGLPKLGQHEGIDDGNITFRQPDFPSYDGSGISAGLPYSGPETQDGPGTGGLTGDLPTSSNVGHDGTYNGQTREQWRDNWMSQGKMSKDQMDSWLKQNGATQINGDKWTTPYGESYDMGIGYKTGSPTASWTPVGQGAGGAASAYSGAFSGGASQGSSYTGTGGGMFGGSGPLGEAISRLLGRGESTSFDTPQMRAASGAFRQAQDRSVRHSRAALAERSAAEGLNSGGAGSGSFDSAIQSQIAGAGLNQANFDAKLTTDEIQARRQDVVNALQFAQGEEKMQLTQMLSEMDNALRSRQLDQSNQQFYDQLGYNMGRDTQAYNLDYLRMLAGN